MTSSKITLYGIELSPPVRAVLLTLKALELDYEFREIKLAAGEHLTPEYLKKNPQHQVPALEDVDGRVICDSHAICAYLVRKYGQQDAAKAALYPKDCYERALVDQRLHYETGVLFATCLKQITKPLFYENAQEIPKDKIAQIHEAYTMLETLLDEQRYVAGTALTIADFSCVATLSTFHLAFTPIDVMQWPKLSTWLTRMSQLPYYEEANARGARAFAEVVRSKLPKQFDKMWQKAVADIKVGKQ